MTVGSIVFSPADKSFLVKCQPHVSMKLKRVFGSIPKGKVGEYKISATLDNARDLKWFTDRYPMDIQGGEVLNALAARHVDRENIVSNLLANRVEKTGKFEMAVPAREYQIQAAQLCLANGGLLLADDVGLGKTCSAICTLLDPRTLPALIVTLTPLHSVRNSVLVPSASGKMQSQGGPSIDKFKAGGQFDLMLRQATGIGKAPAVADFIEMLLEGGSEKVVVFCWHREVYRILQERLFKYKPVVYSGTESIVEKQASKDAFVSGPSRVILMSLRAGAGLDGLQFVSNTVVFAELDWSPGVLEQCLGRVARDGQPDPVMAYFLVAQDGSDPAMGEVLGLKRNQVDGIRDMNADLVEDLQAQQGHVKKLAQSYLDQKRGQGNRISE